MSGCVLWYSTGKLSGNKIDMFRLFRIFVNEENKYVVIVLNEIVYIVIQTEDVFSTAGGIKDISMENVFMLWSEYCNQVTNVLFQNNETIFVREDSCIVTPMARYPFKYSRGTALA
jgi:hypothetical protein